MRWLPMTRAVSSLTTHNMPRVRPSSSATGLYEKVWYVSSWYPLRWRKSIRLSSQVAIPVVITDSMRGATSAQISDHTSRAGRPSAQGYLAPRVSRR